RRRPATRWCARTFGAAHRRRGHGLTILVIALPDGLTRVNLIIRDGRVPLLRPFVLEPLLGGPESLALGPGLERPADRRTVAGGLLSLLLTRGLALLLGSPHVADGARRRQPSLAFVVELGLGAPDPFAFIQRPGRDHQRKRPGRIDL